MIAFSFAPVRFLPGIILEILPMNLDTKHMFVGLLAAILALGVFVWNRSCILSGEIEDLSRKLAERPKPLPAEPQCALPKCFNVKEELPVPPAPVSKPAKVPVPTKTEEPTEVVYGGPRSRAAAAKKETDEE